MSNMARLKRQFLQEIAKSTKEAAVERIRTTKVAPNNRPWAPWAMATLRQRQRKGNDFQGLLWDTGLLMNSFVHYIDHSIGELEVINTAEYSSFLNRGTANMPRREFLAWDKREIHNIFNRTFKNIL